MTTRSISYGVTAVAELLQTLFFEAILSLYRPLVAGAKKANERKLVLRAAQPHKAYSDFSQYKEATIESRAVVDSRGRVLAQMKLWIFLDTRMCFREVTFINGLLRTSVGLNRVPFHPITVGKGDTPATLMEVSVRDFEGWLRQRTPGTQFGIETARAAAAKPVEPRVISVQPSAATETAATKVASPQPVVVPKAVLPAPSVVPKAAAVPKAPAPKAATTPQPNVDDVVRGELVDFGIKKRTIGDRSFEQYCVDIRRIDKENAGMPQRIWGTDLERNVAEARVRLGDRVEIHSHGSLPMSLPGGARSQKNCFTMLVLP